MKFLVIGDVTVDHIYHLENLPVVGAEIIPQRSSMQPGGAGGTMSVTLARLDHQVTLAARVGNDPFAEYALSLVRQSGVDESVIQRDPEHLTSTITVMQTPRGERTMISDGSTNRRLDPSKLKKKDVDAADAIIISAYSLTEGPQRQYTLKALDYAHKAKKRPPVFIDLGSGSVNKVGVHLINDILQADYLTLNQGELLALTATTSLSEGLSKLGEAGAQRVVVKVGKMGSVVWTPEETDLVDAFRPAKPVVDSTGAGDTFTAAFAHAILSGLDLREAARTANAAGALAATALGAQSCEISLADIEDLLGQAVAS